MAASNVLPLPVFKPGRPPRKGERWGGRAKGTKNKHTPELVNLARQYTNEAMATVIDLMRGSDDPDIVLRCAALLFDRGWGKAPQAVRIGGPQGEPLDLTRLDDVQLERLLVRLEQSLAGAGAESDAGSEGRASEATEVEATEVGFTQPAGGDTGGL